MRTRVAKKIQKKQESLKYNKWQVAAADRKVAKAAKRTKASAE